MRAKQQLWALAIVLALSASALPQNLSSGNIWQEDDLAFAFIGQVKNSPPAGPGLPATSVQYGYLSHITGLPDSKIFAAGGAKDETTARYTFYNNSVRLNFIVHGNLRIVTRVGTTTIYYQRRHHPGPGRRRSRPQPRRPRQGAGRHRRHPHRGPPFRHRPPGRRHRYGRIFLRQLLPHGEKQRDLHFCRGRFDTARSARPEIPHELSGIERPSRSSRRQVRRSSNQNRELKTDQVNCVS